MCNMSTKVFSIKEEEEEKKPLKKYIVFDKHFIVISTDQKRSVYRKTSL